ncbi:N-formylglutamate deformylase [Yersinia pekkanenii]|uniref:N-formylglutamate amidohydrolase n=1 Tax=Yersinia pekkanenii TaxID=1288385 RepID=A0A0T9PPT0_9GAMM|nr:N-formylglutamate deformylase [Yersinia pekkanenii]CNH75366.1 putative N-formylglutamate amidohydrolase [Yersinia pekkanenii]CRY68638.1 putative N-formylglutamate amidohydrolase [Yersinia pekkanenii]
MNITDPLSFHAGKLPLLISIPHAGTRLTPIVEAGLTSAARPLSDTDWHIPRLYEFARNMGASIVIGHYSRLVVDLNRPEDDQPLYTTATTGLFPATLFDGQPCFMAGKTPSPQERQSYLLQIWRPYHQQLQLELGRLKAKFGYALLLDAHSIASVIPRLFEGQLPDLNFGTNSGVSCAPSLSQQLIECCQRQSAFSHILNGRFKGGYITRAYGLPLNNQHAVQLELSQLNYMSETKPYSYLSERAIHLQQLLQQLIDTMLSWGEQQSHR